MSNFFVLPTPLFSFPENSRYKNITIKREDCSETGSHKFRYVNKKLLMLKKEGRDSVVLSTTGNLGISASFYGKKLGFQVTCLMKEEADLSHAAQIEKHGGMVILTQRPKRFAEYLAKKYNIPLLRGSRDPFAIECYKSLGQEIQSAAPEAEAIVNFATSGVSNLGLFQAYEKSSTLPALHIVHEEGKKIVLQENLEALVKKTKEKFWTVSQAERNETEAELKTFGLQTSWEGVSSFAVAKKIQDRYSSLVVIFSGRKWPSGKPVNFYHAHTLKDVDQIFLKL